MIMQCCSSAVYSFIHFHYQPFNQHSVFNLSHYSMSCHDPDDKIHMLQSFRCSWRIVISASGWKI